MKNIKWIAVVLCALTVAACGSMPSSSSAQQDSRSEYFYMYGR
ncbi:MAG: hypothetical protein Q8Q81_09485 [Oxalobacteraceae bacterium]|nr:hypothetical protein [Oxalobacteraceae bacterium]